MKNFNRRKFFKLSGLSAMPALLPAIPFDGLSQNKSSSLTEADRVFFINDGPFYKPAEYIKKLNKINESTIIDRDLYGQGTTIDTLTQKLAAITGKEAGIYLPSGTLANQLAISQLSGTNSKVFVQETSHVYRDEADAAQTIFHKRLIPLAPGKPGFTLEELKDSIQFYKDNENVDTGPATVSIEVPVRRCDNTLLPIEDIRKISDFCRKNGYKLHLDGARIHIASAYSGISVKEYASYFDTVYICLYKYLGATGGAVLCGEKSLVANAYIKSRAHGGGIFTNWPVAAMALHHLEGIDTRLQKTINKSKELFSLLKKLPELEITELAGGTNSVRLKISEKVDVNRFKQSLRDNFINTGIVNDNGFINMKINETLLYQENHTIAHSFKNAINVSRVAN